MKGVLEGMGKRGRGFFNKRMLRVLFIVLAGILFFVLLGNITAVTGWFSWLYGILSPFVIAIAIAYLLDMPVRFFARKVFGRFRRARVFAIILTYVLAVALLALLIGAVVPQLYESVVNLFSSLPTYLDNFNNMVDSVAVSMGQDPDAFNFLVVNYSDLWNKLAGLIQGGDIFDYTKRFGSGLVSAITAIIASIYMLAGKHKLLLQIRRIVYAVLQKRPADEVYRVADVSNRVFAGFIGGKIIDSAIIGIICYAFMMIAGWLPFMPPMPYAPLISVIVGVTNIIPFFGPFIGAIPSILILLMVDPWSAVVFAVFILILQQFDGNVLGPKILGDTTGLPILWVLIAIIVGAGLAGFVGMLLGVPVAAVLYTLASELVANKLHKKGLRADTKPMDEGGGEDGPAAEEPPSADVLSAEISPAPDEEE